jgi:hypothetical protein
VTIRWVEFSGARIVRRGSLPHRLLLLTLAGLLSWGHRDLAEGE